MMICEIAPEYCKISEKIYTHGIYSWIDTATAVLNATTAPISKSRWILRISLLSESQENLPNDLSYAEASAEVEKSSFFIIVYPGNNRRNIMKKRRFFNLCRCLSIRQVIR